MAWHDQFDTSNVLDDPHDAPEPKRRKPRGARSETRHLAEEVYGARAARSTYDRPERKPISRGIYDHLAMVFRDAPCYIPQGAPLIAKVLKDRVGEDERLTLTTVSKEPRPEAVVQDIVESMIRWFWQRVPNDERGRALNAFTGEWWDALVEEALDHQRTLRIPDSAWQPAGGAVVGEDPFYAPFVAKRSHNPTGPLSARLAAAQRKHDHTTEETE